MINKECEDDKFACQNKPSREEVHAIIDDILAELPITRKLDYHYDHRWSDRVFPYRWKLRIVLAISLYERFSINGSELVQLIEAIAGPADNRDPIL